MKNRTLATPLLAGAMSVMMAMTALAAGWQTGFQDNHAVWWYDNGDDTENSNEWKWIDGNKDGIAECYYFGPDGYILTGTTTPDGYTVNNAGAWTENGVVQTKQTGEAPAQNNAAQAVAGTSTKSLDDYGYTNGLNDMIYDLPNLSKADVEAMFGDKAVITNRDDGIVIYSYGTEGFFVVFNSDGSCDGASFPLDRACEGLTNKDVIHDSKADRVVQYMKDHGFEPHVYAEDTTFVFRIEANGRTLKITSSSDGEKYKKGRAYIGVDVEY